MTLLVYSILQALTAGRKKIHILALLNNRIPPFYLYVKFNKIAILQNILQPRTLFNRKVF